jgi:3-phosphoshikimate 1-carboxyvinyltransferase
VPGSKSVANRALVCAALADGVSYLTNVPDGDDSVAMLDCVAALGAGVLPGPDPGTYRIDGFAGVPRPGPVMLPTRLAGTTSRFVTAVAALGSGPYTIDGAPPLRRRPMGPLHDALAALGVTVQPGERWGHLPVTISGPCHAENAHLAIRGDISSQYVTALMLIGPYLPNGLRIELTSPLVSHSYVGITAAVMEVFGVDGVQLADDSITVPAGRYGGSELFVEPDASSAGYPLAAAAIVGGSVSVPGLTASSLQGDARFADVLGEMGCEVWADHHGTTVLRKGPLRGIDIDMVDLSDLVPTLSVVAPFAHTRTTIRGVGFIRAKESDRIGDLCDELRRAGVDARETADGLVIEPGPPHSARMGTHHDHRLAMAFSLLGLYVDGIEIEDPDVVSKSWPGYWEMLEALG